MTDEGGGRWWRRTAVTGALVAALALGWWSGRVTLAEPEANQETSSPEVTATVSEVSVGERFALNVTVEQPFRAMATNLLSGVVTAVSPGHRDVGDSVFEVAGVPVRVVVGDVAFYRDLGPGNVGRDVFQLRRALRELGHTAAAPTDTYDAETAAAVIRWQVETGQPRTGTVDLGTLAAVPRLPDVVRLGEGLAVGTLVGGGEPAVLVRSTLPTFKLMVTEEQSARIPADARVLVKFEERTWPAVVTAAKPGEGLVALTLAAPDGGSVCRRACGRLPAEPTVSLVGDVEVTPEVSGPGVPVAAIRTDAEGKAWVRTADEERVRVVVLASGDGVAVVRGVDVGDEILVLGGTAATGADPPLENGEGG